MAEPAAKGSLINSHVQAMHDMLPKGQVDAFVQTLPPEAAKIVASAQPATAWIPLAHYIDFDRLGFEALFSGNHDKMREWGARTFDIDNKAVKRMLLRMLNADLLLAAARATYRKNYQDYGEFSCHMVDPGTVRYVYTNNPQGSFGYWLVASGYIGRLMQRWYNAPQPLVASIVAGGGDSFDCTFEVRFAS